MKKILPLLCLVCLIWLTSCADLPTSKLQSTPTAQTQQSTYSSIKVLNLDSFHEQASYPDRCIQLVPGPRPVHMTIATANALDNATWYLDAASNKHFTDGIEIGTCLIYEHIHYEVASA